MAAEAVAVSNTSRPTRPYARSWLDVFFGWVTALPGPTWVAYVVLLVPGIALSNSSLWFSGLLPWGQLDPSAIYWGATGVGLFAAAHYLRNVAGSAFDRFRPALGAGVADPDRIR